MKALDLLNELRDEIEALTADRDSAEAVLIAAGWEKRRSGWRGPNGERLGDSIGRILRVREIARDQREKILARAKALVRQGRDLNRIDGDEV